MIKLRVNYAKNLGCNYSIFVTFQYNPIYVEVMKSMPKHAWLPENKEWEIAYDNYSQLIGTLNAKNIPYNGEEFLQSIEDFKQEVQSNQAIQKTELKIDTSCLNGIEFKTKPYKYQEEGIAYGMTIDNYLLADDMGLGKSLQTLNVSCLNRKGKHCLIIVGYDALQFNWINEIAKHTHETGHVLGQQLITRGVSKGNYKKGTIEQRIEDLRNIDKIDDFFIVTSVSTLRHTIKKEYTDSKGKKQVHKEFVVADLIEDLCRRGIIGRIIFDEAQVVKSITTDQTTAFLKLKSCPCKIAATGTPIMNKHIDLYPIMSWLGYERRNYWSFREQYCILGGYKNKQIVGNKNGKELNAKLSQFMLRRKKGDVLELPEKIIIDEYLDMDYQQECLYTKLSHQVKQELIKMKGNKVALLSALLNFRKITCHPRWIDEKYKQSVKFERAYQLIENIVENGEKVVVFSNWSTPIYWMYEELSHLNPAVITGDTKDRMCEVNKFQENPDCKVILGTIGAMGTGLTLTAGTNVIFLDEPWNRALKDQSVNRCHRIGTKSTVNVYTLMCRNTIDETVHNTVISKGLIADEVVDGLSIEEIEDILTRGV